MEMKRTSIEDMNDLPQIIYKYRSWKDDNHKKIISEQEVFMAKPTSFEDLLDCKLQKRYDLLTNKDIYNKYLEDSKRENSTLSRQQHRKYAMECFKKSAMRNKKYVKEVQNEQFLEFDKRFGVLSLTANPQRTEMWEKYSDKHQGFCVGFDPKKMFNYLGGGGKVLYYDKLPDISPFDDFDEERTKQVFSKEEKWSFEEEYRTHKFYPNETTDEDRKIKLPIECFKEIIFGAYMPQDYKQQIISICKKKNLPVEFFSVVITENELQINKYNTKNHI